MKRSIRRLISGGLVALFLLAGLSAPAWSPGAVAGALAASVPGTDLTIISVSVSPETASIGDTLTFTVTIKNQGDTVEEGSNLTCFLNEQSLFNCQVEPLQAGTVTVKTFKWKAQAGPHIFRALIETSGPAGESDRTNNDRTLAFSILAPDLLIDSISWKPAKPAIGDKVTFIVTIANHGDKPAGYSVVDFYIDGSARGYKSILGVEAGASANETFAWTATAGVHKVRAVADLFHSVTESDEANNAYETICAPIAPDLIISSVTVSPADITENTFVTFNVNVKNQGGSRSEPSGVTFYADNSLLDWVFLSSLLPGAGATANFTWVAGIKLPVFTAVVDVENLVQESDETNNSRLVSLAALLPDLVVQDITWSPSSPLLNTPVTFTVTVKNQGKATAGLSALKLTIDNSVFFNGMIPDLSVNATGGVVFTLIPPGLTFSVKATADENDMVKESNETNNTMAKGLTSSKPVPTADLSLEKISCAPARPAQGENLTISLEVKNRGTSKASPSIAALYIDGNLAGTVYTGELEAGQTQILNGDIPLKGLAYKNIYRVSAQLDSNYTVFEINELNNQKETTFSFAAPDLVVESVNWLPEAPSAGGSITFEVVVKNRGDLKAGSAYLSYYVDRTFMGRHSIEDIGPGNTVTRSFTWAASRESFVFNAIIDEAGQVQESDEANNARTITLPAPDLIIDSIEWSPEYPVELVPISFTASIHNRGFGRASAGQVSCYIDGAALSALDSGEMGPGGTAAVFFTYAFAPGDHTVRLIADGSDAVAESSESNNDKAVKLYVQSRVKSVPPTGTPSANNTAIKPPVPAVAAAAKASDNATGQLKTPPPKAANDIAGNITAPPPKWQSVVQSKWFIIGFGVGGIGAIGGLLLLRKKGKKS